MSVRRASGRVYDDVIFDFCDVLVDWRPRAAVPGLTGIRFVDEASLRPLLLR